MEQLIGWMWLPLAFLLILGWYLSYSASRLDRLHHRAESARAALEVHLVRRAAAAIEAAAVLDPASGLMIAAAASESLAEEESRNGGGQVVEETENDLSRALHVTFGDPADVAQLRANPLAGDLLDVLTAACTRVQLARRFLNDAVAQAQRVRRKRVVRWARLAGRAGMPQMVEIDDSLPAGLADPAPD